MNKSERRVRKETVNNFYVPPPARNRKLEDTVCYVQTSAKKQEDSTLGVSQLDRKQDDSTLGVSQQARKLDSSAPPPSKKLEDTTCDVSSPAKKLENSICYVPPPARKFESSICYVPPPARKQEGSDNYISGDNKAKDRLLESKLKKTSEEMKICNNSSLLFKTEDHPACSNQGNAETTTKKKKKKKKKSVDTPKHENDVHDSSSNILLKTDEIIKNVTDEPLEDNTEEYLIDSECEVRDTEENREMVDAFQKCVLENNFKQKDNGCCDIEYEKRDTKRKKSVTVNNSEITEFTENNTETIEHSDVISEHNNGITEHNTEDEITSVNTSSNDIISADIDDEYEWEKLLEDGFEGFEFHNLANKQTAENEKGSTASNCEYENNDSSVIEIYGFPEEFKTQDLLLSFARFINRGLKLKWVDNTHALGIFPTPSIAEEALNSSLPFVKTRPLSQASRASKEKAQRVTLPPALRPKTCAALARRLVSGALGVRAVFTKEEREAEREMLKEAREQKRLAAKQREAAWEGKF